MKIIKNFIKNYKDIILYIIFGVLTTLVNIVVYSIMAHPLGCSVMISTIFAWISSVLFAYITNRTWVFHSNETSPHKIIKELISFIACRLTTGLVDLLCMYIFVDLLMFHDLVIKVIANIVVIVLNYVASKLIIFKK